MQVNGSLREGGRAARHPNMDSRGGTPAAPQRLHRQCTHHACVSCVHGRACLAEVVREAAERRLPRCLGPHGHGRDGAADEGVRERRLAGIRDTDDAEPQHALLLPRRPPAPALRRPLPRLPRAALVAFRRRGRGRRATVISGVNEEGGHTPGHICKTGAQLSRTFSDAGAWTRSVQWRGHFKAHSVGRQQLPRQRGGLSQAPMHACSCCCRACAAVSLTRAQASTQHQTQVCPVGPLHATPLHATLQRTSGGDTQSAYHPAVSARHDSAQLTTSNASGSRGVFTML